LCGPTAPRSQWLLTAEFSLVDGGVMNAVDWIIRWLIALPVGACGYWMYDRAAAVTFHLPPTPDRLSSRTTNPSR
jgi:hypothetical protein